MGEETLSPRKENSSESRGSTCLAPPVPIHTGETDLLY